MMTRSSFDGLLGVLWPLFFATVAFLMFRAGAGGESLVFASFGAAVMGIWSSTSTSAGSAMQRERWHGTLELLVTRAGALRRGPPPGDGRDVGAGPLQHGRHTLISRFVFGVDLPFEQPLSFAVALVATVVSIGAMGFLLAVSFVRYRTAWALGNLLEYPVWLIAGFLVPLTILPGWVRPFSWVLAPTWGVDAIREAATGGGPGPRSPSRSPSARSTSRSASRCSRPCSRARARAGTLALS